MSSLKRSIKASEHGLEVITGSFAPNGSSALDQSSVKGVGFSVAYTSTGLYTITLQDVYASLVSATATFQMATATDVKPQFGAYVAASKTLVLRSIAVASVTDIAANANNRISFVLVLKKSDVK